MNAASDQSTKQGSTTKPKKMKVDDEAKTVTIFRQLNPPTFHAWMRRKILEDHPGYTIIEDFDNA